MKRLYDIFKLAGRPFLRHGVFITFMVVLMYVTYSRVHTPLEHPEFYALQFAIDLYLLCALLCVLPHGLSRALKLLIYTVAYVASFVEAFVYARFYLAFSPTMLNLVLETNAGEAAEFLNVCRQSPKLLPAIATYGSILAANIVAGVWGWRLWHAVSSYLLRHTHRVARATGFALRNILFPTLGLVLLFAGLPSWAAEKQKMVRFFKAEHSSQAERTSANVFYSPFYRFLYSAKFVRLTHLETQQLIGRMSQLSIDSCTFSSPNIVLVIGESYNKHHSALYGYTLPTTPYQQKMAARGRLVTFTDVVTPWNMTSNAFKNFLSTHSTDQEGNWTDGVLFPALFRKAGYKVAFITNQFYKSVRQNKSDFSGSFFLNDAQLDTLCFDHRNEKHYLYDGAMLRELHGYKPAAHNLYIYHLMGQHLEYAKRTPGKHRVFTAADIDRPDLTEEERQVVADYDNATRYNDEVFARICKHFSQEDAIIVYMADHGDEVYDGDIGMFGRNHTGQITPEILKGEFEVPFVVWFSPKYRSRHPQTVRRIRAAAEQPFSTDDLPHVMLGLAGIGCAYYDARRDLFSPCFNPNRRRPIKQLVDYDVVMGRRTEESSAP